MIKVIINARIFDYSNYYDHQYIIFDQDIIECGPMEDFVDQGYEIIDGKDCFVCPNFVNGHTHIYSTFARGLSLPFSPKNFQEILEQLWWKLDSKLDLDMIYYSGIVSAVDYIKHGVTTLIDHHASGVDILGSLDALKNAVCTDGGLRGIFAFETSDRFDVKKTIEENSKFIKLNQTASTSALFGLHASMSLSEKTLENVKKKLNQSPIHIHVAESELDEMDCLNQYGERIIHRLHRHGLLNPFGLIAHAIYVDDSELNLIKKQNCYIAVNVTSNMNNSVGIPNLKAFRDKKIPVIVGTDGISFSMANEYLSLYYATHHKDQTPNNFTLGDVLNLINQTYDYAGQRLGIKLGKIQKGFVADLLMIPYIPPTPINQSNAFGHLFFGLFHGYKPKHVFVNGKYVLKNYEVSEDLKDKYRQANVSAHKLWKNLE